MTGIEAVALLALQAVLSGILVGGVYGILSVGLSLAFGVMRIVNFAHGELVMYGMYAGVIASKNFGIEPLMILPLSFALVAAIGAAQYRIVFRHFVGQATLQQLSDGRGHHVVQKQNAPTRSSAVGAYDHVAIDGRYVS